jgi:hypothetical protein
VGMPHEIGVDCSAVSPGYSFRVASLRKALPEPRKLKGAYGKPLHPTK